MTTTACEMLFRQSVDRYQAQAAEGRLPKWVIGETATARRIEIDLDALALGPFEKDKLIKQTLEMEGVQCYAYAAYLRIEDEETRKVSERVLIVCATAHEYIGGDWSVTRAANGAITLKSLGQWSGQDPGKTPGTWFLTDAIVLDPDERARYAAMWAELQERSAIDGAKP